MKLPISNAYKVHRTLLYYIAKKFGELSTKLFNFGLSIRGVWLIGDYLTIPIWEFYLIIRRAEIKLYGLNVQYTKILNTVTSLVRGFEKLVDFKALVKDFWLFSRNPHFWVAKRLKEAFPKFDLLFLQPSTWVKNQLVKISPHIFLFFNAPRSWLKLLIKSFWPSIFLLYPNPVLWLFNTLYGKRLHIRWLFEHPETWMGKQLDKIFPSWRVMIRRGDFWIISSLRPKYPRIERMLDNPGKYVLDEIRRYLNKNYPMVHDNLFVLFEKALRYAWEGVWK